MKNNHQLDIPLIFFSFAFFIIIFGLFSKFSFQNSNSILQENKKAVISVVQQKNITVSKKLDYNLPILCDYQTKNSSISAAISNISIAATIINDKNIQRHIVEGDCLYSWNMNEINGQKKCGIGSFITMGRQLLSSGLGSINSLISMLPKSNTTSTINFQAVFESCKNVKEINSKVFVIPKSVKFE